MAIIYILGAVVVGIIIAMVFLSHLKFFKLTSTALGIVIRSEDCEVRDEIERREETVVVCRYQVKGIDYECEEILRGRRAALFPIGRELAVRYNPAQPTMAQITVE